MARKLTEVRPRFSRIDFFRLRGDDFFEALYRCLDHDGGEKKQYRKRWAKLNPHQQGVYAFWCFLGDVLNGGLVQYFYNHTHVMVSALHQLLEDSGNAPLAELLAEATKIYCMHHKEFDVANPFGADGLFAHMTELTKLDHPVERKLGRTCKQLEQWLRANISLVVVGDGGEPIDPTFNGDIETRHPNGKVFEQATVRRSKLTGAYRRYGDDGTLEYTCFYKGGKVSADYWPNGQLKLKKTKRGKITVIEWYYPSGNIHKRFVTDKSGDAIEPVRRWHENGQLAEEIHIEDGKKHGPWLKFFDDGSPHLQAEHRKGETLVVKNAWDDQRRQTVKNGRGTFFEDGRRIDVSYNLFFEPSWTDEQELHKGIPHGNCTTWHDGILWSRQEYANGKLHGVRIHYYDNGRVRSRRTYRHGKEIKNEEFPKFDDPRPVVLLRVEANDKLYAAWGDPLLDVYPTARDLEQVQAQLEVPPFLHEVFERNLSGALTEEYDNLNTFDDYIAYHVMVTEEGYVDSVEFSGASAYSGSAINIYPPIIRELRFEPGWKQGRKIRCRVVVWVHHTFAETEH